MIYLEYIERDRFVPIEVFRYMGDQTSSWVDADADRMILQLGRTLRLGPNPTYLAFWQIAGLHRLDAWEAYFGSKDWFDNPRSLAMHRSIHIQRAGLYEELIETTLSGDALHAIEFFDTAIGTDDDEIRRHYQHRADNNCAATLNMLLRRLAGLGPDPANLAVWSFPNYESMDAYLHDVSSAEHILPRSTGIYRPFAREIL